LNTIVLASNNNGKLLEFNHIFFDRVKIESLKETGFFDEIVESGNTFIENALIKAKTVHDYCKRPVLADDSGLCVDALNGEPGVFSARYGGNNLKDSERNSLLIKNLQDAKDYKAQFVCALVLYINPNRVYIVQEELKGEIILTPRGENGFGYDPIFYIRELGKTLAELTSDEKNSISHRAKASLNMKKLILSNNF